MRPFKYLTIPERAHPLVRELFRRMRFQRVSVNMLSDRSGLKADTIRRWRDLNNPRVPDLEACLNVVNCELRVVKRYE